MGKTLAAGMVVLLLGPATLLIGIALVMNPAAQAACVPNGSLLASRLPTRLTARRTDGVTVALNQSQLTRAATIINLGGAIHGVGRRGVIVALMAALTESDLRLLANTTAYPQSATYPHDGVGTDLDSLGLFQMRPSTGWGSVADLMDAEYEARAFFGGPTGPNRGSPAGLLDIPDWQELPEGAAAQAVEASAYPERYTAYEPVAEAIVDTLATADSNGSCSGSGGGSPVAPATGFARALIAAAKTQLGKPYVWGGGTYSGPSGIGSDGRGPGFDCSGLVLYAASQASHGRLRLPHYTGAQITFGQPVASSDLQRGDLIFFTPPGTSVPDHVAIYVGGDQIIQAPKTGENVRFGTMAEFAGDSITGRRL